jgi:hypothetical protein
MLHIYRHGQKGLLSSSPPFLRHFLKETTKAGAQSLCLLFTGRRPPYISAGATNLPSPKTKPKTENRF